MNAHPASQILLQRLIDASIADDPERGGHWPGYFSGNDGEAVVPPDDDTQAVAVYETEPEHQGRLMRGGKVIEKPGLQFYVRARTLRTAWIKMGEIVTEIDEVIRNTHVHVDGTHYLVVAVSRKGGVIPLGSGRNDRRQFVFNAIATIVPV